MTRLLRIASVAFSAVLSSACGDSATEPARRFVAEFRGLRLDIEVDRTVITVGDSATVTMSLRNPTSEPVTLSFPSTCQIMPYVESVFGGIVYPGGGWACGGMLTSLEVPAEGVVSRSYVVRGAEVSDPLSGSSATLRRGAYRAYALLGTFSDVPQLRSQTITIEVR